MAEAATTADTSAQTTTTQVADTKVADTKTAATDTTTTAASTAASTTTAASTAASATTQEAETKTDVAKGAWPDDWQKRFAGDDEKELKQVARYPSPEAVWKKARALERRLSSGELKTALPKDPKPEELKQWRKDNGIPETADKYDIKGIEVPESDREIVDGLLKQALEDNMTPAQARRMVASYYDVNKRNTEIRAEKDENERLSTLDVLAKEWGGKFSGYRARVENYLQMFPESVRDAMKSARLPNGSALFNHPDVLRTIVSLSLKDIPEGVVVPAAGGDLGKSITDRYQEIQKVMNEDRPRYNKDVNMQSEFSGLIDALTKHGLIDNKGNLVGKKAA